MGFKVGDFVWYQDYGYEVVAVKGEKVEILELNARLALDREWVDASELEIMTDDESDDSSDFLADKWFS